MVSKLKGSYYESPVIIEEGSIKTTSGRDIYRVIIRSSSPIPSTPVYKKHFMYYLTAIFRRKYLN